MVARQQILERFPPPAAIHARPRAESSTVHAALMVMAEGRIL